MQNVQLNILKLRGLTQVSQMCKLFEFYIMDRW